MALIVLLAATLSNGSSPDPNDQLLPRPVRKHRKAREDQGLPDDEELQKLARAYLSFAHDAWPDLVKSGVPPHATDSSVAEMVAEFKESHRTGKFNWAALSRLIKVGLQLAANYPRYSDPNSQPKSIPDQVRLAIACAKSKGLFVPWGLIVADYARRASSGYRQGFESLLKIVRTKEVKITAIIIDDFDRASRNDLEAWKLAGMCKMLGIGLYGASDGFHIDDPDWDMKVSMRNMFNKMEHKSKRQRVLRGQSGLATQNRPIGRLPLGFARRPAVDKNGNIVLKSDGHPETERCIDPEARTAVELMWDLFYNKKWSTYQIATEFNRRRIDGGDSWSDRSIEMMLINPAYIGLFIWNRTTKVFNWETQRYETVKNPWQKWKRYYNPELELVPKAWHVYARKLLVKPKTDKTRKKRKQPQRHAATLFSGTLTCGYCGRELTLCRSTPKYKHLGCPDGLLVKHGCNLKTSKSTAIIEKHVLGLIHGAILTPESLTELVVAANKYLGEERQKPSIDVKPLNNRAKTLKSQIDRLLGRVKGAADESLIDVYEKEISKLEAERRLVADELARANRTNEPPPPPLDLDRVSSYLADLRAVLSQEIPAAAHALRLLTGPISVTEEPYTTGKKGAYWILTFTPNAMPLLRDVAVRLGYPDSSTLEFLCSGNWITPEPIEIRLDSAGWRTRRMPPEFYDRLNAAIANNPTANQAELARKADCSRSAVARHLKRLEEERGVRPSP